MAISKETVKYLAHLARMELKAAELNTLAGQLKDILGFIDKLRHLDVSRIPATSHILPINNVLREDRSGESLAIARALENAPQKDGSFFVVPKVIE
jgi:aspartyl-tRNA(Asn)/glutamyl-tRNA(Gln) amidotransferase subunit C